MNGPTERWDRITDTSENSSPAIFRAQIDLADTIVGASVVMDGWSHGHHHDLEAVRIAADAISRKARIAQVAAAIGRAA